MENQVRYSDADLVEFKARVDSKLAEAREQLEDLQSRLDDLTDNSQDGRNTDYLDDSYSRSEMDTLAQMVSRTQKHITDLENALLRIKNKVYGVCVVTGQLIDKRRLLAVPTTTKSLEAKLAIQTPTRPAPRTKSPAKPGERKIISKIIRKPNPVKPAKSISFDDLDDEDDLDNDELENIDEIDMDMSGLDFSEEE